MTVPETWPADAWTTRFQFDFEISYRVLALPFGITPSTTGVWLSAGHLHARFGPWQVSTPLDNITGVSETGPYGLLKTAGPAHLTLGDRGLTFATNHRAGVQFDFARRVRGIEPTGALRHPNLTVTVADCPRLMAAIRSRL